MTLLSSIVGFSLFGLAARLGQLGIQKRNPLENLGGHALTMAAFGFFGYWAHRWDTRVQELLVQKRAEIAARKTAALQEAAASGK